MNYTTNYHLPQWAETDRIMMEDFNDAMSDIDQGIKTAQDTADTAESKADAAQTTATAAQTTATAAYCPSNKPYVVGSYEGTGSTQNVTLGFKPTMVIVYEIGTGSSEDDQGSTSLFIGGGISSKLLINDDGFMLWRDSTGDYPRVNRDYRTYNYIAFR